MPNRHTTLTSLFTDIAGAIRSKTGDSAKIKADDFDTAIEAIPTGGGGGLTAEQVLGVDPIDSLTYDGTSLPNYSLINKTINNLSLPNLTTINFSSLENVSTHSNLNTLFSKVETIMEGGLEKFNEREFLNLTSDYDIVFPKLINITDTSIRNFAGTYSEYDYSNYNNPKYNIIMPLLNSSSSSSYSILREIKAVRNFSARNLMCIKNICNYGYSLGTIDIKG